MEMMKQIKNKINETNNLQYTENDALGYKSTGKALLDLNYSVSSLRHADEEKIITLFDKAFYENKEYAVKWLFYLRDVRSGLGERRIFRVCYKRLVDLDVELFYKNLPLISEYGRWDDIISLLGVSDYTDKFIFEVVEWQLNDDLNNMENNKPVSLLGKWLPSENTSSKRTKELGKYVRKGLNLSSKSYRIILSKLRKYIDVVEVKMCNNEWDKINYESIPSLANLKYKDAFYRHDKDRRVEYLDKLREGRVKINMGVATPVDIVSKYAHRFSYDYGVDNLLEEAWKNLKKVGLENTLVVADGSGSMRIGISKNIRALDVAISLAIYCSEHNSPVYKNKYITFSNKPQFVEFEEEDTLLDKIKTSLKYCEVSNTNIYAVFQLILSVAVENNISSDDMVENILIISDMEFDKAQKQNYYYERCDELLFSETLFDEINKLYNESGYKVPKLIFWNVYSRTKTIPVLENDLGVILLSGFSQNVLKMIMNGEIDAYEALVRIILGERYSKVVC